MSTDGRGLLLALPIRARLHFWRDSKKIQWWDRRIRLHADRLIQAGCK